MIVKQVDRDRGGGSGVPPFPAVLVPPPLGEDGELVGCMALYSRRSIGPTVIKVLTQASASRPHSA